MVKDDEEIRAPLASHEETDRRGTEAAPVTDFTRSASPELGSPHGDSDTAHKQSTSTDEEQSTSIAEEESTDFDAQTYTPEHSTMAEDSVSDSGYLDADGGHTDLHRRGEPLKAVKHKDGYIVMIDGKAMFFHARDARDAPEQQSLVASMCAEASVSDASDAECADVAPCICAKCKSGFCVEGSISDEDEEATLMTNFTITGSPHEQSTGSDDPISDDDLDAEGAHMIIRTADDPRSFELQDTLAALEHARLFDGLDEYSRTNLNLFWFLEQLVLSGRRQSKRARECIAIAARLVKWHDDAARGQVTPMSVEELARLGYTKPAVFNSLDGIAALADGSVLVHLLAMPAIEQLMGSSSIDNSVDAYEDNTMWTLLQLASYHGDVNKATVLLANGADPNLKSYFCRHKSKQGDTLSPPAHLALLGSHSSPICLAAQHGNTKTVELLLSHGAKVDAAALILQAAQSESAEMVKFATERFQLDDRSGAMDTAISVGFWKAARVLIEQRLAPPTAELKTQATQAMARDLPADERAHAQALLKSIEDAMADLELKAEEAKTALLAEMDVVPMARPVSAGTKSQRKKAKAKAKKAAKLAADEQAAAERDAEARRQAAAQQQAKADAMRAEAEAEAAERAAAEVEWRQAAAQRRAEMDATSAEAEAKTAERAAAEARSMQATSAEAAAANPQIAVAQQASHDDMLRDSTDIILEGLGLEHSNYDATGYFKVMPGEAINGHVVRQLYTPISADAERFLFFSDQAWVVSGSKAGMQLGNKDGCILICQKGADDKSAWFVSASPAADPHGEGDPQDWSPCAKLVARRSTADDERQAAAPTDDFSAKMGMVEAWRLQQREPTAAAQPTLMPRAEQGLLLPRELRALVRSVFTDTLKTLDVEGNTDKKYMPHRLNLGLAMHWSGYAECAKAQYEYVLDMVPRHSWHCHKAMAALADLSRAT